MAKARQQKSQARHDMEEPGPRLLLGKREARCRGDAAIGAGRRGRTLGGAGGEGVGGTQASRKINKHEQDGSSATCWTGDSAETPGGVKSGRMVLGGGGHLCRLSKVVEASSGGQAWVRASPAAAHDCSEPALPFARRLLTDPICLQLILIE
jgi:hypothetical protein